MIAQSFFYERSCMQKEKLQLAGVFIDLLPFELTITKVCLRITRILLLRQVFSRAKGRYKFTCHVVYYDIILYANKRIILL